MKYSKNDSCLNKLANAFEAEALHVNVEEMSKPSVKTNKGGAIGKKQETL